MVETFPTDLSLTLNTHNPSLPFHTPPVRRRPPQQPPAPATTALCPHAACHHSHLPQAVAHAAISLTQNAAIPSLSTSPPSIPSATAATTTSPPPSSSRRPPQALNSQEVC